MIRVWFIFLNTESFSSDCQDDPTLKCWYYDDTQCRGVYEAFAREHCPLRCGYCPGKDPLSRRGHYDCIIYAVVREYGERGRGWGYGYIGISFAIVREELQNLGLCLAL